MTRTLLVVLALIGLPNLAPAITLRTHLRPPHHGLQVRLSSITIEPGTEREVCQLVTLPNRKALDVNQINVAMPSGSSFGSHHFAMFLYEADDPSGVPSGAFDRVGCVGVGGQLVSPILAFVQRSKQRIGFPHGVGVTLRAGQRLLLNSHYINGSSDPVTIDVAVNFQAARKRSIQHHAKSFQLGTLGINVPPGMDGSASGTWTTPFPMNVVWLSTHSHKHTQTVDVDLVRGGAVGSEELRTTSYSEPTVNRYPTPLRLDAGDGFHWTCNYRNDTPTPLHFGVTSNDEMCFTVGFFYPDDDAAPLPPVGGCFGNGDGLVCPFS